MSKLFYSVGEVAEIIGETTDTVKYWERQFKHLQPKRSVSKIRQYTIQDIEGFKVVQSLLRDKKLTIAGAQDALRKRRSSLELKQSAISKLTNVLHRLEALRDQL